MLRRYMLAAAMAATLQRLPLNATVPFTAHGLRMRRVLLAALFAGVFLVHARSACAEPADCNTLDACLANLREMAKAPGNYAIQATPEETVFITKLLSFDDAVPKLIPLLADPDDNVANIAAAALRDAKYIDPAFLPQVKAGLDRGLGWLPPALGRIQSDNAAREAVARLLVSEDAPENQEAYAVELSGRRAIPFIVEAARCPKHCGPEDHYILGSVLGAMGPDRSLAATGLIAIAQDDSTPDSVAEGALRMIAFLEEDGRSLEPQLLTLRDRKPALAHAIDDTLIGIHSDRAGDILARRLRSSPNVVVLRDLANVGTAGRTAGPEVVLLLDHPDWNIRLAAARTIGYIGYMQSVSDLVRILGKSTDVRLVWVATESLGRLRATAASDALNRLASSHWYPPVRRAATLALANIKEGNAYKSVPGRQNFAFEFFEYEDMGRDIRVCKSPLVTRKPEPTNRKLYASTAKEQLAKLAYTTVIYSYGPAVEPKPVAGKKSQVIKVTPDNVMEHRIPEIQMPKVALRVANGWLAGSDRGEWGGELNYIDDKGLKQQVLNTNVEDVHALGSHIVAVTGLAHLTMNQGMIYQVSRRADGTWTANPWRALPGAPHSSWLVESGELLVNVDEGGSILVSANGSMRLAPCADTK